MELIPITPLCIPPQDGPAPDGLVQQIVEMTSAMYAAASFSPPWIGYFAHKNGCWIGTCAFKGVPKDGRVEIAYYTFPDHENKGVATAMAGLLIGIARKWQPDVTLFAQTLPEHSASTRILSKLGFVKSAEVAHPEDGLVWEWELGQ